MAWFWWFFGVLILILWVFTIVDIIRRRHSRSSGQTAAWILVVLILPVVGTIIYFMVNGAAGQSAPRDGVDHVGGRRY